MKFPVHTAATAPAGSRDTLSKIAANYGFVPNLAGVLAESPGTLAGLLAFMGAYEAPAMTLSALERQVVLLAVSAANRCAYCTAAHSMLADRAGLGRDQVNRLQSGETLDDARLQALRQFAEAVVEHRGRPQAQVLQAFAEAGFVPAQALEVVFGVALKTLTNFANHLANPPVNEQFAGYLPQWPAAA